MTSYSEPEYFPSYPQQYGSPHLGQKTDGFAIAAFVLAFIPGLITFVLTIVFGTKALGRMRFSGDRGRNLAIASFFITGGVNLLVIVLSIGLAAASGGNARYVASVDYDVANTVSEIKSAVQANPTINISTIPPISHGDNVITVQAVSPTTWSVKGYSTKFGNPDRDFEDWTSWGCGCLSLHGSYQNYYSYLQKAGNNTTPQS